MLKTKGCLYMDKNKNETNYVSKETIYNSLRNEVMDLIKRQDKYLLASITMTITTLTFALQYNQKWIPMLTLFLLMPLSKRFADFRYGIVFLASYMAIFLEEKSSYGWEYMREQYYEVQRKHNTYHVNDKLFKNGSKTFTFTARGTFLLFSLACVFVFWLIIGETFNIKTDIVFIIIQVAILGYQIYIELKHGDITDSKRILLKEWDYVYSQFNTQNELQNN